MLSLTQQRQVGIYLCGMGMSFTIAAAITWTRRLGKNRKVLLQLPALLFSFIYSILLSSIATDSLNQNTGRHTTIAAFLAANTSNFLQYFLTYFMMRRLLSLVNPRQRVATLAIKGFSGLVVGCCIVDHIMNFFALGTSGMDIVKYTTSVYFNQIGKLASTIGLLLYLILVFVADFWILAKLRPMESELLSGSGTGGPTGRKQTLTQSLIIILCVLVKIAEVVFKLLSALTTYIAMDSYLRSVNGAVEIWSIAELGVTVNEIIRGRSSGGSTGKPHQQHRENREGERETGYNSRHHKSSRDSTFPIRPVELYPPSWAGNESGYSGSWDNRA